MSGSRAVVTPEGIRDGDPGACEAVCARRGAAVLAYCEQACAAGMAVTATAEAFARFRAAVIATPDSAGIDPDALLVSATRHAAAARAPRQRAISAWLARSLGSPRRAPQACDLAPELLVARAEALLSDADRVRLSRHLQRCAFCRAAQERFGAAEAAYRNPPPGPVPAAAHDAIMRALLAAGATPERAAPTPGDAPGGPPRAAVSRHEDLIGDAVEADPPLPETGERDAPEAEPPDEDPFAAAMADVAAAMPEVAAQVAPAPWVDDDDEAVDRVIAVHSRSSRPGSLAVAAPPTPRGPLAHRERTDPPLRGAGGRATRHADVDGDAPRSGAIGGATLTPLSVGTRRRPIWALLLPLAVVLAAAAVVLAASGVFSGHTPSPAKATAPASHPAPAAAPAPRAPPVQSSHRAVTHHPHHSTAATIALPTGTGGASGSSGGTSPPASDQSVAPTTSDAPAATVTPVPAPTSSAPSGGSSGGSAPTPSSPPSGGGTAGGTSTSPDNGGSSVDGEGSSSSAPPSAGGTPASATPAGTYQPSG